MKPSHIDFSRKPGLPTLGWFCLLLGATSLASAWASMQYWSEKSAALQHHLTQTERESQLQKMSSRQRVALPPAEALRWANWQTQLALPWQRALQAVDTARADPVYLLGLTWQGGSDGSPGQLKLEAQAPGWREALVFVDAFQRSLDAAPTDMFGAALLSSQQQAQDASTGEQVLRFVVMVPLRWVASSAPTQTATATPTTSPMYSAR